MKKQPGGRNVLIILFDYHFYYIHSFFKSFQLF